MTLSRRDFLSAAAALGCLSLPLMPSLAFAAAPDLHEPFMKASRLLINHQLNPAVGARIADYAASQDAELGQSLQALIDIAERNNAQQVEDFFADIPEGKLQELAYWIIFAWYTGGSSAALDAEVFTFEEALTFQTTLDVVTIPSYGISGPNQWGQVNPSLDDLPAF